MVLRKIISLAVPGAVAAAAFLHAHAIGALIDASIPPSAIAPFAEARAASDAREIKSAEAILRRNPFDHSTGLLEVPASPSAALGDPLDAPPCDGVRATAVVRDQRSESSFAALDVGGAHRLRKQGGELGDLHVVFVAADRVWLERNGVLCQARVFGGPVGAAAPAPAPAASAQSALERDVAAKIVKTGPNEFQIDRGAVDRILEAQAELMKTPLVPEKEGDRVVGFKIVRVRPGSVVASLGLESGDRLVSINGVDVTNTERLIEAYARLRAGATERLTIHVVRGGKPTNIDYVVR